MLNISIFSFLETDPNLVLPTLADVQNLQPTRGDGLIQWQRANSAMGSQWVISISYGDYVPETNAFVLPIIQGVVPLRTRGWGRTGGFCIDFLVTCVTAQIGNQLRLAIENNLKYFWGQRGKCARSVVVSSVANYKKKMERVYTPTTPNVTWIGPTNTTAPTPTAYIAPVGSQHGVGSVAGGASGAPRPEIPSLLIPPSIPNNTQPTVNTVGQAVPPNMPSTSWAVQPQVPSSFALPPNPWAGPSFGNTYFPNQFGQLPLPNSTVLQAGGGLNQTTEPSNSRKKKSSSKKTDSPSKKKRTETDGSGSNDTSVTENVSQNAGEPQPSTSSASQPPPSSPSQPSTSSVAQASTSSTPQPSTSSVSQPSTSSPTIPPFIDQNCERCVLFFTLGKDSARAHAQTCQNYKPRKQRVSKKKPPQPKPDEKKND